MAENYWNSSLSGENIEATLLGAVRGDATQNKGDAWKAKARQNIGAAGADDVIAIAKGGTGADNAADARENLGIGGALDDLAKTLEGASDIVIPFDSTAGSGVRFDTGALISSSVFGYVDYIDLRPFSRIYTKRINLASSAGNTGIAFYDENKQYLFGLPSIPGQGALSYFDYSFAVPEGVAFARFTTLADTSTYGEFSIVGDGVKVDKTFDISIEPLWNFVANQSVNWKTGALTDSSVFAATDFVYCKGFDYLTYPRLVITNSSAAGQYGLCFFDDQKNVISQAGQSLKYASTFSVVDGICLIPANAAYVKLTYYNPTYLIDRFARDFELYLYKKGTLENRIGLLDGETQPMAGFYFRKPRSRGIENAIKRATQLANVKWTPLAEVPRLLLKPDNTALKSKFIPGVEYRGIPYSPSQNRANTVGIEVTVERFMSVVQNPKTRMYDGTSTTSTYYGNVCSSTVCAAYGIKAEPVTATMEYLNGLDLVAPAHTFTEQNIEIGDILLLPSDHVILITGIITDANANILLIGVTEAARRGYVSTGKVIQRWWTPEQFWAEHSEYGLYRYRYADKTEYKPSDYSKVYPEAEAKRSEVMDCYPVFGDGCVLINNSSSVDISISDTAFAAGYTELIVYKDGTLYSTYPISSGTSKVTIPREKGKFVAFLNGTNKRSAATRWEIVGGTFSGVLNSTTYTLTYSTDSTIYTVGYTISGNKYFYTFEPPLTGAGTVSFETLPGASSFEIRIGNGEGITYTSIPNG